MNSQDLHRWGVPEGSATREAFQIIKRLIAESVPPETVRSQLLAVIHDPATHTTSSHWSGLAELLLAYRTVLRENPAPWRQWGEDLDENSIEQMRNACDLPISVAGALMPDAHLGYGLPIGGVLATDNAVIPYAVGVDIACRMKMTVYDMPLGKLEKTKGRERLIRALEAETRFGVGARFKDRREHEVMDANWKVSPITEATKDRAWSQLGTSGSGNHFVEYGVFTVEDNQLGLDPGDYLALLSHSGSRGSGAMVAAHYSKLARKAHPELPKRLSYLSWLGLDTAEGQEYWAAMELMGQYAAANHACIHREIASNLGAEVILDIENHHNYAWKENHGGKDVVVHRKGATPAAKGVIGIIPGSMASPAYIVRGKGQPDSLNSAAHGAGRVMSRTQANRSLRWQDANKLLKERNVELISAGLDEVPMVYKDIDMVMAAQKDLVETLGKFEPRIVKMAQAGERPED